MKNKFNLQFFAEGGGTGPSAGAGSEGGTTATASVQGDSLASQSDGDLSKVVYGKSSKAVTQPTEDTTPQVSPEDKAKSFDDMIKKGGEYADEFNKRTQDIINKRFKNQKDLEAKLGSQSEIFETLALKYGVDANDIDGLKKAIAEDDSLYEDAAFKEGLTVKQYKEKVALEKENARLRAAEEQAKAIKNSEEIYAGWEKAGQDLAQKYGIENFDLATECQNPTMTQLLGNGVDFEAAYMAIHFDEMLGGAMAHTAQTVTQQMANNIASRSTRPSEGGMESSTSQVFKSDVNKFTDSDIDEVIRRVRLGEQVYL